MSLVACSSGTSGAGGSTGADPVVQAMTTGLPLPSVSPAPANMSGLTLPIDAYKFSDSQDAVVAATFTTLFNRCMAKLGFNEPSPDPTRRTADFMRTRYGPADDEAAADGYHFRRDQAAGAGSVSNASEQKPAVSAAEVAASGPCAAKAKQTVTAAGAVYGEPDLVIDIDNASFSLSQTDPRVVAVFAAWSRCMKQRGHAYQTPNDPLRDPKWAGLPAASQAEIETAHDDVACKRATAVVGTWYGVESAMQDAAIAAHQQELSGIKSGEAKELRIVAGVLGDGAVSAG
jgi:hypothetical protein